MTIKRFAVLLTQYGLLLVTLWITVGISALVTMRSVLKAQEVVVPNFLGQRIPEAGEQAARRRLSLKMEGRRHDPRIPQDRIVAQEPRTGERLKTGRSVHVWVSLGPERLTIPQLEGQSLRGARLGLEQLQVPLGRVVEVNNPAEESTVLQQRPTPGVADMPKDGVALLVSMGAGDRDYLMPDLIGRRVDEVLTLLRQAALRVDQVRYRPYPGLQPGLILRQTPPSGYRIRPGSTVNLDISKDTE